MLYKIFTSFKSMKAIVDDFFLCEGLQPRCKQAQFHDLHIDRRRGTFWEFDGYKVSVKEVFLTYSSNAFCSFLLRGNTFFFNRYPEYNTAISTTKFVRKQPTSTTLYKHGIFFNCCAVLCLWPSLVLNNNVFCKKIFLNILPFFLYGFKCLYYISNILIYI